MKLITMCVLFGGLGAVLGYLGIHVGEGRFWIVMGIAALIHLNALMMG